MPLCHRARRRLPGLWPAVAAVLLSLTVTAPALADLDTAERALQGQDYETAIREAQPLAEQGDEVAQRIVDLAKLMIALKRLHDEHRAATGPINLRDYDGRTKTRSAQDQARFDSGQRHYDDEAYEAAFREWLPLAEAGDAEVQFMVSTLYRLGQGVAEDPEKADSYLLKAAGGGYGLAQSQAPQIFDVLSSWADEASQREGFYWAVRAAANGQMGGYLALSVAYCHGRGTDKNPVLADIWLYMVYPDKDAFLDNNCSKGIEYPTSYYEAIAERAKALRKAYDIPAAPVDKAAGVGDGDTADGTR